jgi:3-dehydroquinate synthase
MPFEGVFRVSVLTVNLAENSYEIVIERGALASLGQRCRTVGLKGMAAVISNPTVAALYGPAVLESLEAAGFSVSLIEIPDGEEYKNSTTLNQLYDNLLAAGVDRGSFVVALGGGVVGDVAGYAAATWLRGIPFVQVPTTLLAQVDSSVGGKTGIDHPKGKNLIGAFYQPRLVLIDVATLATLDQRQFRAGLAEVIKYGVVIDRPFFEFVEANSAAILAMNLDVLIEIIHRSCQLKAHVVELDEKEAGLRAILNYGHTLGHAFEALSGYRGLVHGEAVAIGMVLAARISAAESLCSQDDVSKICALIARCDLPIDIPHYDRQLLLNAIAADKKSKSGSITFICNQGIGMYAMSHHTPEELLKLSGLEA